MQTTANYGLKKPEGNDTVDIDVINGNMDSIDGELSKRAPGGYGLGTMAVDISNQDLNNYNTTGFFRGSSMTNAPNSDWYYVEVVGHDGNWTLQVATNYFNNNMYYRRRNDGTWQGWVRIANTSDIPSSLPASGGNSTTVGGFSASGTPSTTEKSNLIGMVNELFQSASSGKSAIATAAGSPSTSSETFTQLATDITNGKNNIYNAIVGKGTTPTSKNFVDLTSGIQNIKTGYGVGDEIIDKNLKLKYTMGTTESEFKDLNCDFSGMYQKFIGDNSDNNIIALVATTNGEGAYPNLYLRKYDPNGTIIWSKQIIVPLGSKLSSYCIQTIDKYDNIYISYGVVLNNQGIYKTEKYDKNGSLLISKDNMYNGLTIINGDLYCTGIYPNFNICKLDFDLNIISTYTFPNSNTDLKIYYNNIVFSTDSIYFLKKTTTDFSTYSIYLCKLPYNFSDITNVCELGMEQPGITFYLRVIDNNIVIIYDSQQQSSYHWFRITMYNKEGTQISNKQYDNLSVNSEITYKGCNVLNNYIYLAYYNSYTGIEGIYKIDSNLNTIFNHTRSDNASYNFNSDNSIAQNLNGDLFTKHWVSTMPDHLLFEKIRGNNIYEILK